ncbi:hypothetical protein WOLCODRAFT_17825 [Wolfiporia cocos MD-104 SS10]|uniref:Uncharacterized protein n=1 Tax=Wolfiporia cocos (strain MD-104) TaxID=742152 RepID=A0A2H3JM41_WOLCO|nr:hypothetical protein WOLCODRAFT_17825 [Wolfiporia cocos MD-104 SS10]
MPFWTSKHTDSTLSAISLALRGIKAASSLINGVPGLELAVGSALSLVTTIQVRGNKERAHRLAELVMNSIEHLYKSVASRLDAIDERLERDITTLRRKLLGTQQKIEKQLRKRMHKRILNHHAMSRILDECATDIDDARQVFLVHKTGICFLLLLTLACS